MALPILLEPVRSTMVRQLGFLSGQKTLFIEFHNHSVYAYFGVPTYHYQNLRRTRSVGFRRRVLRLGSGGQGSRVEGF